MDVHAPHEPIHTVRDFFLHLFTITVGLLIALALEAGVEHMHHKHMEAEARAAMVAEIHENRKDLESVVPEYAREQQHIADMLAMLDAHRQHKDTSLTKIPLDFEGSTLNSASYTAAQNTGSFALMPYDEARGFADVYALQGQFMSAQQQALETTAAPLFGSMLITKVPLDHMDERQIDEREALLESYAGHMVILQAMARDLDAYYKKH